MWSSASAISGRAPHGADRRDATAQGSPNQRSQRCVPMSPFRQAPGPRQLQTFRPLPEADISATPPRELSSDVLQVSSGWLSHLLRATLPRDFGPPPLPAAALEVAVQRHGPWSPVRDVDPKRRIREVRRRFRAATRPQPSLKSILFMSLAAFLAVVVAGLAGPEVSRRISSEVSLVPRLGSAAHAASNPLNPVYFRSCRAARAAGVHSIQRGEPGYRSKMDADADGVACEAYIGR